MTVIFPTTIPGIANKWPMTENAKGTLNAAYINATTSSIPGIRAKLALFSDPAKEMGTPNTFVKIAKGIAQYFVTLEASAPAKDFVTNCNTFGDAVKVFSFAKGVDDILLNADNKNETGLNLHKRNLSIASGFFQLVLSGMAGAKLLNTFKVISLAEISEALGTTAVLPFAVVVNGVEIVKNVIDITNKSISVHQTREKRAKIVDNYKKFNLKRTTDSQKIGDFLNTHIAQMNAKQNTAKQDLDTKTGNLIPAAAAATATLLKYQNTCAKRKLIKDSGAHNVSKWIQRFPLFFEKRINKAALFEAKAAHDQIVEDYSKLRAKYTGRIAKFETWTKAVNHFRNNDLENKGLNRDVNDPEKANMADPLNQLILDKKIRWKAINENCKMDNLKDGLGIAINVAATIGLIAATILIFTGIGTIPVLLTMTSLWLLISILGLGSAILKKYTKAVVVPDTDLAKYSFAAA